MDKSELETVWAPRALSVLRIVVALLFLEHGTQKLLHFPHPAPGFSLSGLEVPQAFIELIGGFLMLAGFLTRPVAFILSGDMAVAYFIAHAPRNFFPALNMGDAAILFCFTFLYFVVAGAGAWSIDAALSGAPGRLPPGARTAGNEL